MTIAAELKNGRTLVGQCEISHPSPLPSSPVINKGRSTFKFHQEPDENESEDSELDDDWAEDALGGEAGSTVQNVNYSKEGEHHQSLEAPIHRELLQLSPAQSRGLA